MQPWDGLGVVVQLPWGPTDLHNSHHWAAKSRDGQQRKHLLGPHDQCRHYHVWCLAAAAADTTAAIPLACGGRVKLRMGSCHLDWTLPSPGTL